MGVNAGIFRDIVHMNIHHGFSLWDWWWWWWWCVAGDIVVETMETGEGKKRKPYVTRSSSQNEFHLIYMRKSRQPPSLSWREKPFRETAEINQRVGPWCSLCGLGQRWSHCKQLLALMMCSEPVEACKSAAGISFSAASIPPQPLRYLCHQSHPCAPVWGSSVTISTVG